MISMNDRTAVIAAAALMVLVSASSSPGQSLLERFDEELSRQIEEASRSAVMVVTLAPLGAEEAGGNRVPDGGPASGLRRSIGSGVVIDSLGHILTTSSVVEGAERVEIFTWQNRRVPARLLGVDPLTDLALLFAEGSEWHGARVGDSDLLRPGSWITVLANSYGAGLSVTTGVVSRRQLFQGIAGERLIQVNVPVNPGDTGGMVLNSRGELVGIICASLADPRAPAAAEEGSAPPGAGWEGTGIGFAIPISSALRVAQRLKEGGAVGRGFLGVEIRDLAAAYPGDERVPAATAPAPAGVQVVQVLEGSPADGGGIRRGDMVLEVNGEEVASARWLSRRVLESPPGTLLHVLVERGEELVDLDVTVGRRPRGFPPGFQSSRDSTSSPARRAPPAPPESAADPP